MPSPPAPGPVAPLPTSRVIGLDPSLGQAQAAAQQPSAITPTDEIYHFYLGDPVEMLHLYPDGRFERILLGQDLKNGQHIQYTVARDVWQGSHLLPGGDLSSVAPTVLQLMGLQQPAEMTGKSLLMKEY